MKAMDFKNRWVMVTGASSGLGLEMTRILARDYGAHVIPVARRADRLAELKREIEATGSARVEPIVADLSNLDEVDRAYREATRDRQVYGAILNAGVTHFGDWHELPWEGFENMLALNVRSIVRMTQHLLPTLQKEAQGGGVMLVSSMAGLTPVPFQTAYSATKAFLVHYGAGLHHELEPTGVSLTVYAPGGIATELTSGERFDTLRGWLMPADRCARVGLEAFRKRSYVAVPGVTNIALTLLSRFAPQRFAAGVTARQYRAALNAAGKRGPG